MLSSVLALPAPAPIIPVDDPVAAAAVLEDAFFAKLSLASNKNAAGAVLPGLNTLSKLSGTRCTNSQSSLLKILTPSGSVTKYGVEA